MTLELAIWLLLFLLLLYQLWVSSIVYRAPEYPPSQRSLQLLLIWSVPLFGAMFCQVFLGTQRQHVGREDLSFVRQEPNDGGPMD